MHVTCLTLKPEYQPHMGDVVELLWMKSSLLQSFIPLRLPFHFSQFCGLLPSRGSPKSEGLLVFKKLGRKLPKFIGSELIPHLEVWWLCSGTWDGSQGSFAQVWELWFWAPALPRHAPEPFLPAEVSTLILDATPGHWEVTPCHHWLPLIWHMFRLNDNIFQVSVK